MERRASVRSGEEHVLGRPDAPATVVEWGDYECPYTRRAHPVLMELVAAGRIRLVFRPFPLGDLHPRAQAAAEAAEGAAAQGRFWEMHDRLMRSRGFDDEDLERAAREAELDLDRLAREMLRRTHREKVLAAVRSGHEVGVRSTPSFLVNGRLYDGPTDRESLRAAILGEARGTAQV